VLNALGISSPSLHNDCPLQIITKGSSRLLIGLRSPDLLNSLKPDFEELTRLTPHVGAEGYFVFGLTEKGTESRMFCPALGINEDPVSGNAHGMLGVYLVSQGLITPRNGRVAFRGHQGRWVRRPGVVDVEVESSGKVAQNVKIVGDAVIVYEADIRI
jgi:PhzF family phenazine biosynthesis protein